MAGPELLDGFRDLALETFGFLARSVLAEWGIESTDDVGEIVFGLIGEDLLQKTAEDRREDFHAVYDFAEAFDEGFTRSARRRRDLTRPRPPRPRAGREPAHGPSVGLGTRPHRDQPVTTGVAPSRRCEKSRSRSSNVHRSIVSIAEGRKPARLELVAQREREIDVGPIAAPARDAAVAARDPRPDRVGDLGADLVAPRGDAGADARETGPPRASRSARAATRSRGDDARDRAPPAGVDDRERAANGIDDQHARAVGAEHAERDAGLARRDARPHSPTGPASDADTIRTASPWTWWG